MAPGLGKLIFAGFGLNENGLNEGGEFMISGDVKLVTVQGKSLSGKPRMKRLEFLEGRRWRFDEEDRKTVGAFWVFSAPFFLWFWLLFLQLLGGLLIFFAAPMSC